jgi:hypothetical protein
VIGQDQHTVACRAVMLQAPDFHPKKKPKNEPAESEKPIFKFPHQPVFFDAIFFRHVKASSSA